MHNMEQDDLDQLENQGVILLVDDSCLITDWFHMNKMDSQKFIMTENPEVLMQVGLDERKKYYMLEDADEFTQNQLVEVYQKYVYATKRDNKGYRPEVDVFLKRYTKSALNVHKKCTKNAPSIVQFSEVKNSVVQDRLDKNSTVNNNTETNLTKLTYEEPDNKDKKLEKVSINEVEQSIGEDVIDFVEDDVKTDPLEQVRQEQKDSLEYMKQFENQDYGEEIDMSDDELPY